MEETEKGVFSSGCRGCNKGGDCVGCARREPRGKLLAHNWLDDLPGEDPTAPVEVLFKNTRIGFYKNPSA
ncbi:MAG: hypothetical protein K2F94_01965, partial [Muribaculaceae bacterium]|nr:hypothetical protein [Muribaculaceae bacterium]